MFKPMFSLFWHHITDYWWRCLAAVVLIVVFPRRGSGQTSP